MAQIELCHWLAWATLTGICSAPVHSQDPHHPLVSPLSSEPTALAAGGTQGQFPIHGDLRLAPAAQFPNDARVLTTVTGESWPAVIQRVRPDGSFDILTGGRSRNVPADTVWSWGRWRGRHVAPQILLVDGSRLTVDDPLGRGISLQPQQAECQFPHRYFGLLTLPVAHVTGLVMVWPSDTLAADRLADRIQESTTVDIIGLTSGDEIQGKIQSWTSASCQVASGEQTWEVPSSQLGWVCLADRTPIESTAGNSWVSLADASQLHVKSLEYYPGQLSATLATGLPLRTENSQFPSDGWESFQRSMPLPTAAPSAGQVAIHARLLSQQLPASFQSQGWMRRSWPLGINRTAAGGRLRCPQAAHRYGLSMHAPAAADFEFQQPVRTFVAELCLEASTGRGGSVVFRVLKRNGSETDWIEVFRSHGIRGGEPAVPCRADLGDATALRLAVDVADQGHVLDRALWLNARVCP